MKTTKEKLLIAFSIVFTVFGLATFVYASAIFAANWAFLFTPIEEGSDAVAVAIAAIVFLPIQFIFTIVSSGFEIIVLVLSIINRRIGEKKSVLSLILIVLAIIIIVINISYDASIIIFANIQNSQA